MIAERLVYAVISLLPALMIMIGAWAVALTCERFGRPLTVSFRTLLLRIWLGCAVVTIVGGELGWRAVAMIGGVCLFSAPVVWLAGVVIALFL